MARTKKESLRDMNKTHMIGQKTGQDLFIERLQKEVNDLSIKYGVRVNMGSDNFPQDVRDTADIITKYVFGVQATISDINLKWFCMKPLLDYVDKDIIVGTANDLMEAFKIRQKS